MARFPGCYTRMILGYGCLSTRDPPGGLSRQNVDSAIERVSRFRFVGELTSWHLSVCLFNKIITGYAHVAPEQLHNGRPTPDEQGNVSAQPNDYNTSEIPNDWADNAIYAFVQQRFRADLARHSIHNLSDCPVDRARIES